MQHRLIATPRLTQSFYECGEGTPVLFIHGNASSAVFWHDTLENLSEGFWGIAPDLRGYGQTEDCPIDATRGVMDWVDDLLSLLEQLNIDRYHVVGHSLGGSVVWGLLARDAARILSVCLVAPGSPYGFGGTSGKNGVPCSADFAGSGGGTVNPDFPQRISQKDTSSEPNSPRDIMNRFYWKPPFSAPNEEALLEGLLDEKTGPQKYPGDFVQSDHWPFVAPGVWGPINAISPKYVGSMVHDLLAVPQKPPILWIRGDSDQIVSDESLFDFGTLGQLGILPDWPGIDTYPPQPMVSQTRYVLDQYAQNGGHYQEVIFFDTGHTPFIEKPTDFYERLMPHLKKHTLFDTMPQS